MANYIYQKVDLETGESSILGEGYTVISKKEAERNKRYNKWKLTRETGRNEAFTQSNMETIGEVSKVLTAAQCGYLLALQCYVGYDEGLVINADKSPMNTSDMMTVLKLESKRSTFYKFIKVCIDNDILINKDRHYYINTKYHFQGALNGVNSIKTYIAKFKKLYKQHNAADVGILYKLLPFVHMSTNAICSNPFERDAGKINCFNRKELAEILGINPDVLARKAGKIKFDGKPAFTWTRHHEMYLLNYKIFRRFEGEPDNTLKLLFSDKNDNQSE